MASKIYTKTGDKGNTSLIGGTKVSKSHLRIEAYGTVDELNSYIGLCRDLLTLEDSRRLLQEIQDRLFTLGSHLALDPEHRGKMTLPIIEERDILVLEERMDAMEGELPELKNFVLPGGSTVSSVCHIARCICRRAERNVTGIESLSEQESMALKYLNRLSDYLFVLARLLLVRTGAREIPWKPRV